jgi:hypothetical protein
LHYSCICRSMATATVLYYSLSSARVNKNTRLLKFRLNSASSMQHNVHKLLLTSDPAPCLLILSLEHGKQNLWWGTEGHWTKCVSSSRSWHSVHLSVVVLGTAPGAPVLAPPPGLAPVSPALPVGVPAPSAPEDTPLPLLLSLDVTVVELTWRLPDDRRELVDPVKQSKPQFYIAKSRH